MKTPTDPQDCYRCHGKGWVYDHRQWPVLCNGCVGDPRNPKKKATPRQRNNHGSGLIPDATK